jgi:1,5-anhydro-D-fructose reductase (1,5-anhydro-D-mannitol-forming)
MTLGIAVLGTGRIVETGYVPAFKGVPEAKLVALLSRDQKRGDAFAAKTGIPKAYADLGALLRDPAVDAVIVATPDATHEEQVIAAAKAGKHILCEKPRTTTLASAKPMAEAVRKAGVTFAMGYDNRFNAGLKHIKDMIDRGELGPVRYAHAHLTTAVSDPNSWRAEGGQSKFWAMSASGTHVVDIFRWYFGDPAEVTGAMAAPAFGVGKDEIAIMIMNYPGKLIASLTVASVLPAGNRIELHGDKGTITGEQVFGRTSPKGLITHNGKLTRIPQTDPFVHELRDFIAAIRDKRAPLAGLDDGVRNLDLMDKAFEGPLYTKV